MRFSTSSFQLSLYSLVACICQHKRVAKGKETTYLDHVTELLVKVDLTDMRNTRLMRCTHGNMNMRRAARIVTWEKRIIVNRTVLGSALQSTQVSVHGVAIHANGVGLPDMDLSAVKWQSGGDVDDLQS